MLLYLIHVDIVFYPLFKWHYEYTQVLPDIYYSTFIHTSDEHFVIIIITIIIYEMEKIQILQTFV